MQAQTLDIAGVTTDQVELLRDLSIQTFTETFAEHNSDADMQAYIRENLSSEKLITELNSTGSAFYFLKSAETVIGYLKINTGESQTEKHNGNTLEIERIYVLNQFHGKGMGKVLLNKAMDVAKENASSYIWLGVWEENHKAISFYTKNGFKTIDKHIFKLGEDEQTDLIMKLDLN